MAGVPRLYRPSALIKFTLRLEDSAVVGSDNTFSEIDPFPDKSVQLDRSIQRVTKALAAASANRAAGSPDGATLAGLKRQLKQITAAREQLRKGPPRAAAQTKEGGDRFSISVFVVPLEVTVENNGLTTANSVTASFPWLDCPFYSFIMRGAGIDVQMGTVEPGQFAQGSAWVLPQNRAKLMFRGFVDTWKTNHSDSDATVTVEARSFESVLMDAKINPLAKAYRPQKEEPISVYVNRILDQFPQTSGKFGGDAFRARWVAAASTEPVLSRKALVRSLQTAASRNQTLINQGNVSPGGQPVAPEDPDTLSDPAAASGVAGSPTMPPRTPGQEMSVWDLIMQACEIAGCLPTYDPTLPIIPVPGTIDDTIDPANALLLRPAQTIFEDVTGGISIPGGPLDKFSRAFSDPQDPTRTVQSEVRFMIWGHNITSLETSRKLGKIRAPAVEVVSYNPDAPPALRRLSVRFPNVTTKQRGQKHVQLSKDGKPLRASAIGAKGEWEVDKVITKVVQGVRDLNQLQQIAVSLYNALSVQEVSVTIETDDMASYIDPLVLAGKAGGAGIQSKVHNDDPDILSLSSGTPCRVTVARQFKALDGATNGQLVITPLSDIFNKRTDELSTFLQRQNDRFGTDTNIKTATDRIAAAMKTAKMADVFYVRTVTHHFSADDGYKATIELVTYGPARSRPADLNTGDQVINDQRKLVKMVKTLQDQIAAKVEDAKKRLEQAEQARHF